MSTTDSPIQRLTDESHIKNLVSAVAYSQDWLDYGLFTALWQADSVHFDMSSHLPTFTPTTTTAAALADDVRNAISGFDGTRHLAANVAVSFPDNDGDRDTAEALAQVYAHHALGSEWVVAFTTWRIRLERQSAGQGVPTGQQAKVGAMGDWLAVGITVSRDFPMVGDPELYTSAAKRTEQGLGRPGKA